MRVPALQTTFEVMEARHARWSFAGEPQAATGEYVTSMLRRAPRCSAERLKSQGLMACISGHSHHMGLQSHVRSPCTALSLRMLCVLDGSRDELTFLAWSSPCFCGRGCMTDPISEISQGP
jgi:hypothetical protein